MWEGKFTEELKELFIQYKEMFVSFYPDEYEEIDYYAMTYEEFVIYIKECLRSKRSIPNVVE